MSILEQLRKKYVGLRHFGGIEFGPSGNNNVKHQNVRKFFCMVKPKMEIYFAIFCLLFLVAGYSVGRVDWSGERARQKSELEYFKRTYLTKQGGTTMIPNANSYRLISVNGGEEWLALSPQRKVLGTAEEVYPGLVEHLDAMDRLLEYTRTHGPINPLSNEGLEMLNRVGFKVVKDGSEN
jgi:hypothetical protein